MSCSIMFHRHLTLVAACTSLFCAGTALAEESPAATPLVTPVAEAPTAPAFTGHIDLLTKYILRGLGSTYGNGAPAGNSGADAPESNKPVLQFGVDYVDPSGLYVGYFGSMINYSYERLGDSYDNLPGGNFQSNKSIENDFYAGYNGKYGDFGYTIGGTGYVYINGRHADALETKLAVSYGDFSAVAQTLLNDVVWGNKGDTYWTLNYTKAVDYDITFNASLGYYSYKKNGKYLGSYDTHLGVACGPGAAFNVSGCFAGNEPSSGGFRHVIVGFTQPIAKTGLTWGLQGILAGENRFAIKQKNKLVASLSYGF